MAQIESHAECDCAIIYGICNASRNIHARFAASALTVTYSYKGPAE